MAQKHACIRGDTIESHGMLRKRKLIEAKEYLDNTLVTGLRRIYKNNWLNFCDLTISCADGEVVSAPKLLLAIHSEYFAALFRHEPGKTTVTLPQFDSGSVKFVIESLIFFDEKELSDVELDGVIRVADYFQMTDLVTVISDLMEAYITNENLHEIIHLSQQIQVPNLKKAWLKFIEAKISQKY